MFCCGIYTYEDLKQYMNNYARVYDIHQSISPLALKRIPEIDNEWENIPIPLNQ